MTSPNFVPARGKGKAAGRGRDLVTHCNRSSARRKALGRELPRMAASKTIELPHVADAIQYRILARV